MMRTLILIAIYSIQLRVSLPQSNNSLEEERGIKFWKKKDADEEQWLQRLAGDSLDLRCSRAEDMDRITWTLNGTIELSKSRLRTQTGQRVLLMAAGKTISFEWVSTTDSGNYSCHSGNETHHTFHLSVGTISSFFDLRSPLNCLIIAILVDVIIFSSIWGYKSGISS